MTDIIIRPRADQKFDIYVRADNGHSLLNSSQGYERAIDAETVVRNLFGGGAAERVRHMRAFLGGPDVSPESLREADIRALIELLFDPKYGGEPTRLTVEYRDGRVKSEVIG
ncbi:MAG: hypothetical protein WBB07_17470 [Mycobacterium sp.]